MRADRSGHAIAPMVVPWVVCVLVGAAMLLMLDVVLPAMGVGSAAYASSVMLQVGVMVIAAVSLNIVNGFTGQFSMGHAGFMAVGGYVAASVTYYGSLYQYGTATMQAGWISGGHVFMLIGIVAGALVSAGLGYLVGLPSLRLRGDYLAIVTLGFGEIVRVVLQQTGTQVNGKEPAEIAAFQAAPLKTLANVPLNGSLGFEGVPAYANNGWIWMFAAITCVVAYRIKESSSGRAFLSIREDEIAARAMGIDLTKYKVRAFVLAAFFAGIAGGLLAHAGVPFSPTEAGFQRSFEIIIMVVLGGLGSVSGAVLAAIGLTILGELLRSDAVAKSLASVSSTLNNPGAVRMIIYALLLIGVMLLRPKGLFGVSEIWNLRRRRAVVKGGAA